MCAEPTKKYKDRIFTRRVVGWPGVKHLTGDDFSSVIASAKKNGGFTAEDCAEYKTGPLMTGFGQKTVLSVADKVIAGVQAGAIKHFFVIGGCDGSEGERKYVFVWTCLYPLFFLFVDKS
jgi:hydroxylamine reductase